MKRFILLTILIICWSCGQEEDPPPNILFIEVDDLTAKYLGCFGAEFAKTPYLDSLASRGVVFENAVVQGTMCTPSRNSLVTALYPHELNLYENLDINSLPKGIWNFPKALKNEGYHTIWVGKNHLLPNSNGIGANNSVDLRNKALQEEMGFDQVFQSMGRSFLIEIARRQFEKEGKWKKGLDAYGDFLFENNLLDTFYQEGYTLPSTLDPNTEYMDGFFTTMAIEKMKEYKEDDPLFMYLNYSEPHPPFTAPVEFDNMFNNKDMPVPIDFHCEKFTAPKELRSNPLPETVQAVYNYRKRYSASIAYMDSQVGRLLDFINTSRFSDNTVIVFFSDHGIMTGDHGLVGKYTLYKEVLNPALIVSYPKEYKVHRVVTAVELLDLGKTVLDIAGASEETLGQVPNGNSLVPLLKGKRHFTGSGIGFSEIKGIQSAFNGDYKYISHPQTPILFNLMVDPDESMNVIEEEPEVAAYLKRALDEWLSTPVSGTN